MLFLLACGTENDIKTTEEDPSGLFDTGDPPPPEDSATEPMDSEPDTREPPWATIVSPDPGATIDGCDGVELSGQVGDPDGDVADLVVTWYANGVALWFGPPEADGATTLDWDPGDGDWDLTLEVLDADGLTGSDAHSFTYTQASATPTFTWTRSAMDERVSASSVGTCMADALALPTYPDDVWDNGTYTPASNSADGLAAGRMWASWDQVYTVDCHLFQLTVEVPDCAEYSTLRLDNPWYDGIPINDDVYVYVDGVQLLAAGTQLGAGHAGPAETDTWMAEAVEIPLVSLSPGTNVIDVVVEEIASWGGLGYLEPSLE
jgi:hypothetical protein